MLTLYSYVGKTIKCDKPLQATYPDPDNENVFRIPDFEEDKIPPLPVLRKIVQTACSTVHRKRQTVLHREIAHTYILERLGDSQSMPWTEISWHQANYDNIFVKEQPQPPGFPLIEPSAMDTKYALTWVEWLHRRQDGEGDQSTWFTFRVIHTSSLNSIPPNCQASRKSKVQKGSSEV
jgi:hypothetical protein